MYYSQGPRQYEASMEEFPLQSTVGIEVHTSQITA